MNLERIGVKRFFESFKLEPGFTLIEVLVALVIVALIAVMLMSYQVISVRNQTQIQAVNVATHLAESEIANCQAMAAHGDFLLIQNATWVDPTDNRYRITRVVTNLVYDLSGNLIPAGANPAEAITVTVTVTFNSGFNIIRSATILG